MKLIRPGKLLQWYQYPQSTNDAVTKYYTGWGNMCHLASVKLIFGLENSTPYHKTDIGLSSSLTDRFMEHIWWMYWLLASAPSQNVLIMQYPLYLCKESVLIILSYTAINFFRRKQEKKNPKTVTLCYWRRKLIYFLFLTPNKLLWHLSKLINLPHGDKCVFICIIS